MVYLAEGCSVLNIYELFSKFSSLSYSSFSHWLFGGFIFSGVLPPCPTRAIQSSS